MLPRNFRLENLDEGIREVVINLNRIPSVFTNTTCEGHIWRDCSSWPTKNGWIHLNVEKGTNKNLITKIRKEFIEKNKEIFDLEDFGDKLFGDYIHYTLSAFYESHDGGSLFDKINEQQQQEYFQRAEIRREEILVGWKNLNEVIVNYLIENFDKEYKNLPFLTLDNSSQKA